MPQQRPPWPLYLSARADRTRVLASLQQTLGREVLRQIELRTLRDNTQQQSQPIDLPGLLYLPYPYVVPGGRFNEMYGWDSYFIVVGLLRDGGVERARQMVDNFIYEIDYYGTILNATRRYYLTRSQPPFLTAMILAVFERTQDRQWLASTLPAIEKHYTFWVTAPHLAGDTELSRYFDFGEGPAPEVVSSERDAAGRTHYDRIQAYYRQHAVPDYDTSLYYDPKQDRLTPLFYKGDRTMRESGFDPSNHFGPFGIDIIHYVPVDLNALLYRMERETARIHDLLGSQDEAERWWQRTQARKQQVDRYLWDEQEGLYFDYNFRENRRRLYEFATTFYPLWVGMASKEQAARVAATLFLFGAPGGLLTSTTISGNQWDAPFGWAPLQLIAAEGLRSYGYDREADRLAAKFIGLVVKEFEAHHAMMEKYDVVQRKSEVATGIYFGYSSNEIGFGWTNAAFLELLADLGQRCSNYSLVSDSPGDSSIGSVILGSKLKRVIFE